VLLGDFAVHLLRQCFIIFMCLAFGELVVNLTKVRFPAPLIGMLTLTSLLKAGWIKLEWVQDISHFFLQHLGLFFVPPGVALMLYFDLIEAELLPIAVATIVSTLAVLAVTAWSYQLFRRRR
jgi:holin-like protein